jgi:hypothetical protein
MIIPAYNTIYSRVNTSGAASSFEYTPIDNNYSMEFDGTNYIDCGNAVELQITGALTISCWVKSSDTTDYVLIQKDEISANRSYALWGNEWGVSTQVCQFIVFNGGVATTVESVTNINDGNWHNVVAVFNPSTSLSIYIDGSLDAQNTTSIPATIDNDPAPFQIGRGGNGAYYMDGNIDEVAAWNSALSEGTIEAIYNTTNDNPGKAADLSETPEGAPTAWYRFE